MTLTIIIIITISFSYSTGIWTRATTPIIRTLTVTSSKRICKMECERISIQCCISIFIKNILDFKIFFRTTNSVVEKIEANFQIKLICWGATGQTSRCQVIIKVVINFTCQVASRVAICSRFLAGLTAKLSIVPHPRISLYPIPWTTK